MSDSIDHSVFVALIVAGIAIILFWVIQYLIRHIVKRLVANTMRDQSEEEVEKKVKTLRRVLISTAALIIGFLTVLIILYVFGVDVFALLAGVGVASIAVGFAAQTLVKDYINGFFILAEDHFRVEDEVIINDINGIVENISLRTTLVRDSNGWLYTIPNREINTSTNMSRDYSRVNMTVSVGYDEDLNKVFKMIDKICHELADDPEWKEEIISIPKVLRVDNLGKSGIDIIIRGDTMPGRQKAIMGELRLRIKNTFMEEGILIPWSRPNVIVAND